MPAAATSSSYSWVLAFRRPFLHKVLDYEDEFFALLMLVLETHSLRTTGLDQFIGRDCFLPTVIMFLGYGLAVASSTYCLSFFFSDHTMAQNVVLLINFFSALILMVISFIMGLIKSTVSANSFLKNFFRLSPGFCYADGLASLALLRQGMKDKSSDAAFDWNVTGASICYLGVEHLLLPVDTWA
ncbi:hypothetical protein CsatA_007082 [Cannabis sativa]